MIENFEDITFELNDHELNICEILVARFKEKPGKENIVTNPQIIKGLFRQHGIKTSEPRIRKIIQYIRLNRLLPGLVGVKKGYYLTNNVQELESWVNSMIQRENIIRQSRILGEQDLDFMKQHYIEEEKKKQLSLV